jgi:hypothetical protein
MDIDWGKAPEWAIAHALWCLNNKVTQVWVGVDQWQDERGKAFPYGGGTGDSRHNPMRHQFQYETLRPVAWNGEGWPPVGLKCEMRMWPNGEWEGCQPVYYLEQPSDHSDQVVVYQNSLSGDVCYILDPPCAGSIEFRPIRTPEQIAAEERAAAIEAMCKECGFDGGGATFYTCAGLYDAGYRKQTDK